MCDMYIDMLRQRPCLFVVVVVAVSFINNQKNGGNCVDRGGKTHPSHRRVRAGVSVCLITKRWRGRYLATRFYHWSR